jgi:lactate racemase
MNQISLAYGSDAIDFAFTEERFQILTRDPRAQNPLTDVEIGTALDSPIASPPLEDLVEPGNAVLLVVSDATRATGSAQLVNILVRRLIQFGIAPQQIAIIFATGIHRAVTQQEKLDLLTPFIVQRIKVLEHNASDPEMLVELGMNVTVNRALRDFDRVIVIGGIGFHYFAGFTGGRKSICPGLASVETVESTHMLALDFEHGGRRAGVGAGLLDGNAVHEACERVAALIEPTFVINTLVDDRGRLLKLYAGHWREAHRIACEEYLASHSIMISEKRELVIVSCGGLPYDINLIQAHKALEMASYACTEGGTIILLAECRDGLGRNDFLKWFEASDSRALEMRLRKAYEVNGQTAWSLLTKAERFRILLVSSLRADEVHRMRMTPCTSLNEALKHVGDSEKGFLMTRGAAWLPVAH